MFILLNILTEASICHWISYVYTLPRAQGRRYYHSRWR